MAARRKKQSKTKAGARKASRASSGGSSKEDPQKRPRVKTASRAPVATHPSELPEDGKLYYRIGEVSRITGVKPYVLRYWESEFRWMSPQKSRSKQRLYRRKDIEMILLIRRLLHEERYTIAGARKRLRELGVSRGRENGRSSAAASSAAGLSSEPIVLSEASDSSGGDLAGRVRLIRQELEEIRSLL
jgi:DNA-binding transcriptional MerR regulator